MCCYLYRAAARSSVDVGNLQQQVKIMQEEMAKNCAKLSASENVKTNLEARIARYEEQLRKVESGQVRMKNLKKKQNNYCISPSKRPCLLGFFKSLGVCLHVH